MEIEERDLGTEQAGKLPALESPERIQDLYKGLQQSVAKRLNDQTDVNTWFYNLELCFCENYVALANVVPVAAVNTGDEIEGVGIAQADKIAVSEV